MSLDFGFTPLRESNSFSSIHNAAGQDFRACQPEAPAPLPPRGQARPGPPSDGEDEEQGGEERSTDRTRSRYREHRSGAAVLFFFHSQLVG
jgi:hypothetical protein